MEKINIKLVTILLGIALLLSLGNCYSYYKQLQVYKAEQAEFKEFQEHKKEQKQALEKLLEEHEKMQRDIGEITNLEKKLRRAIMRDETVNKAASEGNTSAAPENAGKGGSKESASVAVVEAQNKQINSSIANIKKSVGELLAAIEGRSGSLASFPDKWPTDGGTISSGYGGRTDPIASGAEWHAGIDIAADFGVPVYASGAGIVEHADWNGGYGRYVRINHGNGYKTAYGHMSSIATEAGKRVAKGEIIGFIGSTGYSTGPHVHFEVIAEGQTVDPYYVLKK